MKEPSWIKHACQTTSVNWTHSQSEIYKKLGELGIYEIRFTNLRDKFALEFLVQLRPDEKPRALRLIVPLKYAGDNEERRTKELNMIHRVLLNHLKVKFVAVAKGLTESETEFMAHLVIMDKNGNSRTRGDALLPEYRRSTEEGKGGDFKLLSDGNQSQ